MNYLLPCPTCGQRLTVSSAQAGQTIACSCGQSVEVPPMRHLRELETASATDAAQSTWTRRQGLVFLGCALLLISGSIAGYLVWRMPHGGDREAIRAEIESLDPATAYIRYQAMRHPLQVESPTGQTILGTVKPLLDGTFDNPMNQWLAPNEVGRIMVEGKQREALVYWLPLLGGCAVVGLLLVLSALLVGGEGTRPPRRPAAG